ncbi:hypothetical protein EV182_003698 [Spiromyces aspiralis]|uniref:Uncharacterized protein n=1 Tax=Spiromyces aspiralis TaxID=68401 RepID=A0ACC1HFT5_9FUNG|nr:hypothetical protein EV182_003698 [Spiromyces aspiralis]
MELEYLHKVRQQTFASAEEGPASTDSSATTVMFPEPTCVEPMGSRSDDDIRNAHFGQLQQRGASFASVATPRCPEVPVSVSLSEFGTEYVNLPSVIQQAKSIISRGNNRASGRRRRLRSSTITTGVGAAAQLQRVRNSRQRVYRNRIANAAAYQVASYPAAALPAASGNELARGTIEDCRLHRLDSLVVGFRSAGTCAAGGGSADRDKATAVRNNSYPSGRSPP